MKAHPIYTLPLVVMFLAIGLVACSGKRDEGALVPVAGSGGNADVDGGGNKPITIATGTDSDTGTDPGPGAAADGPNSGSLTPTLVTDLDVGIVYPSEKNPADIKVRMAKYVGQGEIANDIAREDQGLLDRDANVSVEFSRNSANTETIIVIRTEPNVAGRERAILRDLVLVSRDIESRLVIWSQYPGLVDLNNYDAAKVYGPVAINKIPLRFSSQGENINANCTADHYRCFFKATRMTVDGYTGQYANVRITGIISYNTDLGELSIDIEAKSGSDYLERITASGLRIE